jgi:4-amino-4-deoxy-L-arabinose transferase-like glycosyltransferase
MSTINKNQQYQIWHLTLLVIMFFSFYFALGSYPLLDNNDGLYASIAKYMLLSKSFIIPHLNCVPYIEKPPLLYWLLTLSFSTFGFTAFAARFVTATSATLICFAMLYFAHKIKKPRIGITATLIFASSIGVSIIARMVYFDMLLTLLIGSCLLCLFYWYETQKITVLRAGYILLGLAILTKGLLAIILICGSFGLFLLLEKSFWKHLRLAFDWPGILLFLATVLPWHITATIQHKGFFWNYIVGEHFLRFLDLREPHDYYHGPIYYYLPRILIYLFPWSFFVPLAFLRTKTTDLLEKRILRFCWCWLVIPLLFFSFSSAKANYYMIVSMPALAIILGFKLNVLYESKHKKLFNTAITMILFAMATGIAIGFIAFSPIFPSIIACKKAIMATVAYGLIAGTASLIFIKRPHIAACALAGLIIPVSIMTTTELKLINEDISAAKTGIYLAKNNKNRPIYLYQDFENISAIAFYANTCFKIIDSQSSDLYYGSHLPQSTHWFVTKKEFLQKTGREPFYVVVPTKKLQQFYKEVTATNISTLQQHKNLTIIQGN